MNSSTILTEGGFSYAWREGVFLSYRQARYGLERLWSLTAGKAKWVGAPAIQFEPIKKTEIDTMISLPAGAMPWILLNNILPDGFCLGALDSNRLPALCVTGGSRKLQYNGRGNYPLDLVAATFILLTRWEEWVMPELDKLGRHMEGASLCARQNFRDRPVLDEWAMMLRPWLVKCNPLWQPALPEPSLWVSHDIDHMRYYKSISRVARGFIRGLITQRSPETAFSNICEGIASLAKPSNDPCVRAIDELLNLDELLGVSGTFFFMSAKPSQYDEGYDINSYLVRKIMSKIKERGHEIGWHPGYIAAADDKVFAQELESLKNSANVKAVGVRHHYLRWRAGKSWKRMADYGIHYDSSIAYSDCLGFRASTAHFYPAYDLENDSPLPLEVRPLVTMDGPLFKSPSTAAKSISVLMSRCHAVNGCFSILIHNYTMMINPGVGRIIRSEFDVDRNEC